MEVFRIGEKLIVRIDRGEEVIASLTRVCEQEGVRLGSFTGIGAAEDIELGYYDVDKKEYSSKTLSGQHEITGLVGNIAEKDGSVYLHAHITVGDREFKAHAGHLSNATVSATCEVVIAPMHGSVTRVFDDQTGLNLFSSDA